MYKEEMKVIGSNIRKYRLEQNVSQNELARRCRASIQSNISMLEQGKRNIQVSTLLDIAKALQIEPHLLLENIYP